MAPEYARAFVGLLVVANVAPILPVVVQLTAGVSPAGRRRWFVRALTVGNLTALAFALAGGGALAALGIRIDDVRVAGGLILLVFSTYDLLFSREARKLPLVALADEGDTMDLVPLAVPVLVGPATLAAVLVSRYQFGIAPTVVAIAANAVLNTALLLAASATIDRVGHGALRAAGKVFGIILASYAVAMIRAGLTGWMDAAG